MFKASRSDDSRAANSGLLAAVSVFALLIATFRFPVAPAWVVPALSVWAPAQSRGPQLAALPPSADGDSPPSKPVVAPATNPAGNPPKPPLPTPAVASPPRSATGMDISQYQCGDIPVGRTQIAVVQVSRGSLSGPPNPCYVAQARWAGPGMQTYIYMNGVADPTGAVAASGSSGTCAGQARCLGYNFGWNWTQRWVRYSRAFGVHPGKWWLDVEKDSGWTDPATNSAVILGALDALRSDGISAGIYSSATQWNAITGGLVIPGVSLWVPGAGNLDGPGYSATGLCANGSQAFAGGHIKYVQYGYTGNFPGAYPGPPSPYDLDYAC